MLGGGASSIFRYPGCILFLPGEGEPEAARRLAVENWHGDFVMLLEGEPRGICSWGLLLLSCRLVILLLCGPLGRRALTSGVNSCDEYVNYHSRDNHTEHGFHNLQVFLHSEPLNFLSLVAKKDCLLQLAKCCKECEHKSS